MLKWNKYSLRRQMLIIFILLQLFLLIFLLLYFNNSQRQFYLDYLEESLKSQAILLREQLGEDINYIANYTLDNWAIDMGEKIDKRITLVAIDGLVLADSEEDPDEMDNHRDRPEIESIIQGRDIGSSIRWSNTVDMDMLYLALPIYRNDELLAVIRISESLQEINITINRTIRANLLFFFLIMCISIILLWRLSKGIIDPLSQITNSAEKLAKGNFQERIKVKDSNYEIITMSQVFNKMAGEIENKIEQISDEKNRAEAILKSMVEGLVATDSKLNIKMINPSACKIFDINEEEIIGTGVIEVFRHHEIEETLKEAMEQNKILSREIILKREKDRTLRCNFAPINNDQGIVIGGIVVFNDISELRRLEQLRKDFVGNVSHELRTPLTSIIGYVDTILENEIKDERTLNRFLKIIKVEADRLSILINDLLDLSKLENRQNYVLRPANINTILEKLKTLFEDKARKKDIKVELAVRGQYMVYMIPEQIEQVLINLLDNAIKYTPAGGEVFLKLYDRVDKVLVEVIDNGIGVSVEEQDRIFERFYRVDKARCSSGGGTGIGLSIVKHVLQNHNSKIELESSPGKGSLFRFRLNKVSY
ncbi:ATP-binding protein [Natronospora cellulosivora (SeqCode)]